MAMQGNFEHVYPLLKQYQAPAVFSVFPGKLDGDVAGRSNPHPGKQLKTMAADPLVTIASHSVTHPPDLTQMMTRICFTKLRSPKATT